MNKLLGAEALQTVVYEALSTIGTVYDDVPETASMPYIRIGRDSFNSDGSKTHEASWATVSIDVYSDYNGLKEVKEISGRVSELISGINTIVNGFSIRYTDIDSVNYEEEDDGIRHASMDVTFRVTQ